MKLLTFRSRLVYKSIATILLFVVSLNSFSQQAWTRVPSPDASTTRNILTGISGMSSSDVWAVGHFESITPGNLRNLIMHWDGASWQLIGGTDLSSTYNDLWDVVAITANDVWAAGTYNDPGTSRSQLIHWNGTSWSNTSLPNIPGGSFLFAIDAISANDIWAVGGQSGSPTKPSYAIHYNGSAWIEFPVPSPGSYRNWFNDVDGIASNDVWAVGLQSPSYGTFHPMAQHWDGSTWTNSPLPPSVLNQLGDMESVTMISSNNVWALGSTVTGDLIMIHWDGSSWSEVPTAGSSGGKIVSRGPDIFSVGDKISQWNGTAWTVIDDLNQLSYPSLVTAVTFPNGDIWTAGRTVDTDFHTLVYRTANAIPQFIFGNAQTLNTGINSSPQNIDERLKVQDADMNQVVVYDLITPPSHGIVSGLPDTTITSNGLALPSGVTYVPATGYTGTDMFEVKVSVGPLTSQTTLNINILATLPVSITNYSISKRGITSLLKWSTSSEINAKEYIMQRSNDGINFNTLNHIAAKGVGFHYELVDPTPFTGWNYYRLQQVDIEGRLTTFPVMSIKFDSYELPPLVIYPNPVDHKILYLHLNIEGDYMLALYDLRGQQVMKRKVNDSSTSIQIILPNTISTGVYLLSVVNNKTVYTEKIFIR